MATTTISAAGDIQDTNLFGYAANFNNGAGTNSAFGGGSDPRAALLLRISGTLVPSGNVTAFRFKFYIQSGAASLVFRRVAAANNWIEGTTSYTTAAVGEPCWNKLRYNTDNWAGSAGCSTANTDYIVDGSDPTHSTSPSAYNTVSLPTTWATDWRDGIGTNNGFIARGQDASAAGAANSYSSDSGTNPMYLEIDSAPVVPIKYLMYRG